MAATNGTTEAGTFELGLDSVGRDFRTRGGWKARVVWVTREWDRRTGRAPREMPTPAYGFAIHRPGESGESTRPACHANDGMYCPYEAGDPVPRGGHPADLVGRWEDEQ